MRSIFIYSVAILSGLMLPLKSFSDDVPSIEFLEFLAIEDIEVELLGGDEVMVVSGAKQQAKEGDVATLPEQE